MSPYASHLRGAAQANQLKGEQPQHELYQRESPPPLGGATAVFTFFFQNFFYQNDLVAPVTAASFGSPWALFPNQNAS